jgi:hypothetical protein
MSEASMPPNLGASFAESGCADAQDDLNAIAFKLNSRPRKIHGFRSPLKVYAQLLVKAQQLESNSISSTVALGD